MSLDILIGFDGSCPHHPEGLRHTGKSSFILYPGYRKQKGISEEVAGAGSRFSTRIRNSSSKSVEVTIQVDWHTPGRMAHHDLGYIRHERDTEWTMIPATREQALVEYHLTVRPGITHLGLYPEYNYEQCVRWMARLKKNGAAVTTIGHSREGRDMRIIHWPSPNPKAHPFFIQTRDHAYETAGSYCAEGIADLLQSNTEPCRYLRQKFNVYLMPMTNPDGVYNGMSRLSWEQGADLNRLHTVKDTAHATLKKAVDSVRPLVHMNVHNWIDKFRDGLLCNEGRIAERILLHMPNDTVHYKYWFVETHADYLKATRKVGCPDQNKSWKDYCKEQFGALGCNFEFPWFLLNTADMRAKGQRAFTALALAAIDFHQW